MSIDVIVQFAIATMLPVVASAVLAYLRQGTGVSKLSNTAWQAVVGIVFGAIAIFGTEAGIPVFGAVMNVRDAAPLAAGLLFGGPAGIIAGVIGGVERWVAVMWGVGEFTRLACSLGTVFAGVYAALLRKFMFERHIPNLSMSFASGVVVEVLHLMLVFVTHPDESTRAFEVAQACALPMITCVGLSTMLCSLVVSLVRHQPVVTPVAERNVARILHTRMLIGFIAAFLVTVGFTAILQTSLSRAEAESLLKVNVEDVGQGIADASMPVEAAATYRHVGKAGMLVAIDEAATVVSIRDDVAGESIEQLARDASNADAGVLFTTAFAGEECFALYQEVEGYRVIALLPTAEANASRDEAVLITSFMEVLVFAALFIVIYAVLKRVVVRSIRKMNRQLGQITDGDLNVVVDVREASELASLSDDINQTVGVLKNSLAIVKTDLEMAAKIQSNTLPDMTSAITARGEFSLYGTMEPAKEVGGDFYDFFLVDDDHLALVVADVSGKGVAAALFMMQTKVVIKMEALSGLSPQQVLERANADLSEKNDDDMFATAWIGVLEISTGKLTYADAGHEKLAFFRNGAWELPAKPNGAIALASFAGEDYDDLPEKYHFRNHTVTLASGDAIFQYTDGVTEATNAENEFFGEERLLAALNEGPGARPADTLSFVHERIAEFVGGVSQFDDITMLGLLYKGPVG